MKLPSRKATLISVGTIAGVALLGGGVAVAVVGPQVATAAARSGLDLDDSDARITGTVEAPREIVEDDAKEAAALRAAATLSPEDAAKAATDHVPGSAVLTNSLDDEDGFVVYEVEVRGADGTVTEVTVDAGDGRVLATDIEDDDDHYAPVAPQPNQPQENQQPQAPQGQPTP